MIPMTKIFRRLIVTFLLLQVLIIFPLQVFADSEEAIFEKKTTITTAHWDEAELITNCILFLNEQFSISNL